MYIARATWPSKDGKKIHQSIWLRESYREGGKVKKRNIANLKNCAPEEILAIELALKHKNNLKQLEKVLDGQIKKIQGPSVGAVWALKRLAEDIGLIKVLGKSRQALLCLWLILARLIDQGSRLSAVRLAKDHAAPELLGLDNFSETDLYKALDWISDHQDKIEKKLFTHTYGECKPNLFLYDVTSSYLEGDQNELGEWGYNRDRKRGKKQVVIGLLTDDDGAPISIQVYKGNTSDINTFADQIHKTTDQFGCERVTMVGDRPSPELWPEIRGMIKSGQIEDLKEVGFNYITAITKAQIRSMIKRGTFQLELFDDNICEVEEDGVRYILRRNPTRAMETAKSRAERIAAVKLLAEEQNQYLAEHKRADPPVAIRKVWDKDSRLETSRFLTITCPERRITVEVDEEYLAEAAKLDGCYVIKTDLPKESASMRKIHDRYKDLADVETVFRTIKTDHLEVRPIYVRQEKRTRGHAFIVMLAYLIRLKLKEAWRDFDITVEEGLKQLTTLCAMQNEINGKQAVFLSVPVPRDRLARLFKALNIDPPETLPRRIATVDTKRKLQSGRK